MSAPVMPPELRDDVRAGFGQMINAARAAGDQDAAARLELCREYFTNPGFHQRLHDLVYELTSGALAGG